MHLVARTLLNAVRESIPGAITYMECEEIGAQSKTAQSKEKDITVNNLHSLSAFHYSKVK